MAKSADPIVFGPEYAPVGDPHSTRANLHAAQNEDTARQAMARAICEEERLAAVTYARSNPHIAY